jgi:hypothetical protein
MVKEFSNGVDCICSSRPECVYPHTYALGTPQHQHHHAHAGENRNNFEVGIDGLKDIVPKTYLLTTGDLVSKLKVLQKDALSLAKEADRLIKLAKKTQGKSQFLETSIDGDGKIFVQAKTTKVEKARRSQEHFEETKITEAKKYE